MAQRGEPVTKERFESFFQEDGRIVEESVLRQLIFRGGLDPDARQDVWRFLFGMFPFRSTYREREVILKEKRVEYLALKRRWQHEVYPEQYPDAMSLDGLESLQPDEQFMFIQAQLTAMRHQIDMDQVKVCTKIIKKDVPRTDRTCEYYHGDDNEHLQWLNDILMTFAIFHQDVGYAQGMNDVLSLILYVVDHEADAYYCFSNYISLIKEDFMEDTISNKLHDFKKLIMFMDEELMTRLNEIEAGSLVFCHRWLLLGFKREFEWQDSVKLFEILSSHYLELNQFEAEREMREQHRRDREAVLGGDDNTSASTASSSSMLSAAGFDAPTQSFAFELFVGLGIMEENREKLLQCRDVSEVFVAINSLTGNMDLDTILSKAESGFFDYCRRSVSVEQPKLLEIIEGLHGELS